jgi:hypothetical protein
MCVYVCVCTTCPNIQTPTPCSAHTVFNVFLMMLTTTLIISLHYIKLDTSAVDLTYCRGFEMWCWRGMEHVIWADLVGACGGLWGPVGACGASWRNILHVVMRRLTTGYVLRNVS